MCVVRADIGEKISMCEKLDSRYDSKLAATRNAKISKLEYTSYSSLRAVRKSHFDRMATPIEQLRSMGTIFEDALAVDILMLSFRVLKLDSVTASIPTLSEDKGTWGAVSARLTEEQKCLVSASSKLARASYARDELKSCAIRKKDGYYTQHCFLRPVLHLQFILKFLNVNAPWHTIANQRQFVHESNGRN